MPPTVATRGVAQAGVLTKTETEMKKKHTDTHRHTYTRIANQMEADAACSSRGSDVKQVSLCLFAEE